MQWNMVVSIVFILLGLSFTFGSLIVLVRFINQLMPKISPPDVHKKHILLKDSSVYDAEIYKVLCKIQQDTSACKVIVARFHNGGVFRGGMDMEKFSITHETSYGSTEPMQSKHVATLNSRYGSAFLVLATLGYYIVNDVHDCPDPNFKRDMEAFGFKSTYLFLIKQFDGSDEGFIGVNFSGTKVLTPEQVNKIENHSVRILGLLNMNSQILRDKDNHYLCP